jgi:hypothetical protein
MGSMPIVEGAVSDLFGKPLFFALYDWFLEVKPLSSALFLFLQFCHNPCTSAIFMFANKLEIQRSPCKFLTFSESLKMAVISYVSMQHGPVYKLAFGPKGFVVVSDPIVTHHILERKHLDMTRCVSSCTFCIPNPNNLISGRRAIHTCGG